MTYYYFMIVLIVAIHELSNNLFIQIGSLLGLFAIFMAKTIWDSWGRTN